ncbi:MAG: quinone oxidoreductase [Rhodospirillaceae bacterium]|jgi:NADPH2:quinone reductase|nr:quinone oxidoreductase [Rhodospirillaceae bacterium]MBT5458448.1 quinone oxidoreductase [Rhodospirillaceae bacterium]
MKAIRVHELGGPEVLRYEDVPEPEPAAGEALVRIEAAGVNFLDIYYRSGFHWGGHHGRNLPYIPGAEGAGTVVAVGDGVTGFTVGDRVAYGISNGQGSYAELKPVPAWHLFQIPDAVDFMTAGAVMQQGMTAHYLSNSVFPLEKSHTALVHAAAGGTGLLLVQMAKRRGATVIGTVSTAEKAALVSEAGADEVIVTGEQDFLAAVRDLTDHQGVDVVFDSVGLDTFERSLDCLAPKGAMVLYGQSSGPVPPMDTAVLNAKGSLSLWRPSLTHYVADRHDVQQRAGDIFRWIESGDLAVTIGGSFSLAEAADAHRLLASRASTGKLVLKPA